MVAGLVFCLCQNASAELAAVGPVDATNHFPSWYMDGNGTALELCLTSVSCVFDPAVAGNSFSVQIGFGEKAFYWSADATLSGVGAKGSISMGLVASFTGSTTDAIPADGEQIVYFQIVVGPLTGLTAGGVYTVIHPYGVLDSLVADGSGTIPVQTRIIGCASQACDFTAVLRAGIGPFLIWDRAILPAAPGGFIGNPTVSHRVTGSPFGSNIFRIDGPNAGGSGIHTKQTELFKVQGNLFTGAVPTPLVVDRATFTRPSPSAVNVLAKSAPTAVLLVSGAGITPTAMRGDGNGNFFAHIPFAGTPPDFVTVTSNTTATIQREVVDVVTIHLAEYNSDLKILTIEASSSDQVSPLTLEALGFGDLNNAGTLVVPNLLVPPKEVTVVSSAGGSDTARVTATANIKPIARNDSVPVLKNTAAVIDVLENDTAVSGDLDPTTVRVVTIPTHGTALPDPVTGNVTYTPFTDYVGKDSFKYTVDGVTVIDGVRYAGATSNVATVNITVVADETLTVTKALFTPSTSSWQISGKSTVKSGNEITLYRGTSLIDLNKIGTALVDAYGNWNFSKPNPSVGPGGETIITAKSTIGTVATFPLTINVKPVAKNDTAPVLENTAVAINVLANDTITSGNLDPTTVTIVTPPTHGTAVPNPATGEVTYTPFADYVGKDSFKYTVNGIMVIDGVPYPSLTSNAATVTISVVAGETLTVTKATYTASTKWWQISGKSTAKSYNQITLYVGSDTTGEVIGTATVNVYGNWSLSNPNSPVDPAGAGFITAQSTIGTVTSFLLTTN